MIHATRQQQETRHLDIGCGSHPRNPYECDQLYGVDLFPQPNAPTGIIKPANLALVGLTQRKLVTLIISMRT